MEENAVNPTGFGDGLFDAAPRTRDITLREAEIMMRQAATHPRVTQTTTPMPAPVWKTRQQFIYDTGIMANLTAPTMPVAPDFGDERDPE